MAVVASCALLALVHAFVVGHAYFVGSFDDDASYILAAQALANGHGLTGHLLSGNSVVSAYPPGFALVLLPIELIRGASFVPFQVLSALCYAAVVPLTWVWLKRIGVPDSVCVGTVVLLGLNVVAATFGAMVMAEMPYLVCLMLLLLAAQRWERTGRALAPAGIAVAVLGAELVWLKEAGVGFTLGVVLWYLLRRRIARAVLVAATLVVSLVPFLVARLIDHIPLAGARYSSQLSRYYSGNLVSRVIQVLPGAVWHWLTVALPATVVPDGAPLPNRGPWAGVISIVFLQITIFTLVGMVVAIRRHRDLAVLATVVYFTETVFYVDINERRVILVLPIILAWYCLGIRAVVLATMRLVPKTRRLPLAARRRRSVARASLAGGWAFLGLILLIVPLSLQFPRDYLFGIGIPTSHPGGSRYMAVLAAVPQRTTVVESDYRYTTALFSGHPTAETGFFNTFPQGDCTSAKALAGFRADHAGFLLVGTLNKHNRIDSPCLLHLATTNSWGVRLLRTRRDRASVFELIGPDTAHPNLRDLLSHHVPQTSGRRTFRRVKRLGATERAGVEPTTPTAGGSATFTWRWGSARRLDQVSLGEAGLLGRPASGTVLQIESPAGTWTTVARAAHGVGDRSGDAPFLLAQLPASTYAQAMRVIVDGTGRAFALDAAALGPSAGHS